MKQIGVTGERQKSKQHRHRHKSDGIVRAPSPSASRVPQGKAEARLPTIPERYRRSSDGFTALDFASVARCLTQAVRSCGLECPLFRSPPDIPGVSRTLRRNSDGTVTVSVVVRGRSRMAVVADMIEGVTVAHGFDEFQASAVRDALWRAVSGSAKGERSHDSVARPIVHSTAVAA